MRLNTELKDEQIEILNDKFSDILTQGNITKIESTDSQSSGTVDDLPSIGFYFNERKFSRIYQMINVINGFELDAVACHQPYIR